MNLTAADRRSARTFDRAVDLWTEMGHDHEEVRQRLLIDVERVRGKRGQELDAAVTAQLLDRWWNQGLERQTGLTSTPLRAPGHQIVADRKRKRLEEVAGPKLQVFERATAHLKKNPGQFDLVAAILRQQDKVADPPTVETLLAWWQNGLWVDSDQVRPPISDVVANHVALYEQQADAQASTFRRENKYETARGGLAALDVLAREQRHLRDVRAAMATGGTGKVGLDRIAIALMESLAEDLADPGRLTAERKYEWITRIQRLQLQTLQRQQALILAQNSLGEPGRSLVLGISSFGATQDPPAATLDSSSASELAQRARELAENMEAADRLPLALDQALEAEVSREGV